MVLDSMLMCYLQAVFRVGRSMLHLASVGLSALDKWTTMLPPDIMKSLLVQVLPHLDPFLRSKGKQIKHKSNGQVHQHRLRTSTFMIVKLLLQS